MLALCTVRGVTVTDGMRKGVIGEEKVVNGRL
jgi:hypothetical protein